MCRLQSISKELGMLAAIASILFIVPTGIGLAQSPLRPPSEELTEAIKLIGERRNTEAVDLLNKAITRNGTNPDAWFYLGLAYIDLAKIKEATKALERAIELDPSFANAHLAFSDVLLRTSKLEKAASEARRAFELQPDNPYAHYTYAFISFRAGAMADVIDHADIAIKQKPDFVEAYLIKAQALINRYGLPEPSLDEATKEHYKQLYRSAAEPLARYVELTRNQESAEIWGNQAQLLSSVPPSGKSEVFVGREVTTKARLISKPEPTYTEAARQYQVEGTVVLKAVFSSSGKVTNIRIYRTLPSGLTEQAVKAARRIQFTPAVVDGKNVSMWIQLEYNFNLY
ncbi:MAG TPA: TonB family protein [Pyrinomonadaceae bacterium]